ncbi:MAG: C4-type zinc ribbon domain-containing protein [Ilumatobacteraceae bacterium]|nr:C4-type zinc ribbon domain-containing protein [Ilumatobacteraceae bacterium]
MNASAFLALQDIDTALDVITHKRPRLPELIAHQEATIALADLRTRMATAQQRIDAAQASIEAAEHAAADLTKKRTRLEAQLKTVIAPREAEALMHEIETINGHRDLLDDEELAALEEQAACESTLLELFDSLAGHEGGVTTAKAELDAVHATVDAEVADLRQQRSDVVAALGPDSSALYERVRKQFGGVGVARLEGSHCSGCHMDLSPRELDIVKAVPADTLAECPQCGRIIVR